MTSEQGFTCEGSCHCGAVRVHWTSGLPAGQLTPRACDCAFCCKHGARYLSDPDGGLRIRARHADDLAGYRQGSQAARFWLCRHCGVLLAVSFVHEGSHYGAVNAGCLDDPPDFAPSIAVSPQQLDPEDKQRRWRALWMPDVEIVYG